MRSAEERYKSLVAVHILLIRENTILLLQRQNTGYRDGEYALPAGHLEEGETLRQASVREAKEEASVTISESDLQLSHVMHRDNPAENRVSVDCYFTAKKWQGEPAIGEPDKCSGIGWFSLDNLPSNIIPYEAGCIRSCLNGVMYSEYGWK